MKKTFLSILFALALCLCLSPMALAAEPTPTDITATGLKFGDSEANPVPTTETVYTAGSGTVTYRPAGEGTNAKLIMDNATINGEGENGFAIYLTLLENTKIDVELKGTNTLNSRLVICGSNAADPYSPTPVEVTIQPAEGASDASLSVTYSNYSAAVYISGKLTVQGSINVSSKNTYIDATGNYATHAFYSTSDMTIRNGAVVTAESNNSNAIEANSGSLYVDNATLTASGYSYTILVGHQVKISNNATVTSTNKGKGSYALWALGSGGVSEALVVENGATFTATMLGNGNASAISGSDGNVIVNGGTMNLIGGTSWCWSTIAVKNNGKVTLAADSALKVTGSGKLEVESTGTFENNGTVKFTERYDLPDPSAIPGMNLSGSGIVQLGADDQNPTYYTNNGTQMKGGEALNLGEAADSDALETNGYALTTGESGAKTLTLGSNVRLGTITLPTRADTTIVLSGSAYIDTITGGSLTVHTTAEVASAALMVSRGTKLGGDLTVGNGVTLFASSKSDSINSYANVPGITFTNTSGSTVSIGENATLIARGANELAIKGTVTLPADYYYRTAPNGSYLRGSLTPCDLSRESYVELSTTKPAGYAASKVNYMAWDAANKHLKQAQCEDPNTVASSSEVTGVAWGASGKTTWYVVEDNVSISGKVTVLGDVHLILCDGKTLTTKHIEIESGSLTVYGKSGQSGKLSATGLISAAIYAKNGTSLTVNGGKLSVNTPDLTGTGSSVEVYGISVTNDMTVNGGEITVTTGSATMIGTNEVNSHGVSVAGKLTVNGGTLNATGGSVSLSVDEGATDNDPSNAYSFGIFVESEFAVNGGSVTARGGDTAVNRTSGNYTASRTYAIFSANRMTLTGGTVTTIAGTATLTGGFTGKTSCGLYAKTNSEGSPTALTVSGGTMRLENAYLVKLAVSGGVKLADLLADGYAFWQSGTGESNGSFAALGNLTELSDVTVESCTHSTTSGVCAYCGKGFTPASAPSAPSGGSSGSSSGSSSTSTNQIVFTDKEETQVYKTGIMNDPELIERLERSDAVYGKEIVEEMSPLLSILLTWILPVLIFAGLGQVMSRKMMDKAGGGSGSMMFNMGKSNAKVYVKSSDGISFDDVEGVDEAEESLTEIVDYLHDPGKYKEIGATMPKGVLLVGPPGTGKTMLAKAVAGEANVPFFSISGSEFVEMFVGMGASKVRDLFKQAKEKAPCIVFIDEIDAIGQKRNTGGSMGGNDEREQTLNQLLTEMDGFEGNSGVMILAATNRPESLDPALTRPGRFDRRVPVELPDLDGREKILKVHAKKIKLAEDVDFKAVARMASGASGAELANIINEAALRAVRDGRRFATQADLEESIEVVIAGYQKKNAILTDQEKRIVAYHEIGHALVAAKQSNSAPVQKITIVPRTSGALGYTMQVEEGNHYLMSREEIENKIATYTGGRAAEEIVFGSVTTGASNDIEQATKLARAMIARYGMSKEFDMVAMETVTNQYLGGDASLACSAETQTKIDELVVELVKRQHDKAAQILMENREKLDELSGYLYDHETITGEEFMRILNG